MLPTSLDVARSISGSWRLMSEGDKALKDLDLSRAGFAKSYGAILLTAPAFIVALAAHRAALGMNNSSGLFDAPLIALQTLAQQVLSFAILPAIAIALVWNIARSARGTTFLIAWNWAEVIVTGLLALPAALYALGWAPGPLAIMYTIAFGAIAARLRFAVTRQTLGLAALPALSIVTVTFAIEITAVWLLAIGRF
jgi:hypothetical protein